MIKIILVDNLIEKKKYRNEQLFLTCQPRSGNCETNKVDKYFRILLRKLMSQKYIFSKTLQGHLRLHKNQRTNSLFQERTHLILYVLSGKYLTFIKCIYKY